MQKSSRKTVEKINTKEELSSTKKVKDDVKKIGTPSTPRNFIQKSSTTDIYAQKKNQATRAPKKVGSTTSNKTSPMSSVLKSSPSTASLKSHREKPREAIDSSRNVAKTVKSTEKAKNMPALTNVTVSTPPSKRKLDLAREMSLIDSSRKTASIQKTKMAEKPQDRQRQKTRTLTEEEVKMLSPDGVDNNQEMKNLLKLNAQPKAFFVDLEEGITTKLKPTSPDASDVSYEDDFESYESDFESYHSDRTGTSENRLSSDEDRTGSDHEARTEIGQGDTTSGEFAERKEGKDEERMLDSGNFDMERRSATRPSMADIAEAAETPDPEDKKVSLPDEGFQEMSSSSIKSHVEVLERPLFIDFEMAKMKRRKRLFWQRQQQRAKDILSMVKLHEMSYSLFEMQPIPYDLYMATFGKQNFTQTQTQTFEDGVTEETQTDDISIETKWTQHPVKFSKSDHYFRENCTKKSGDEDLISKFTFIFQFANKSNDKTSVVEKENKVNPLKIYLEQKEGVGTDQTMPQNTYEQKLLSIDYNTVKLNKFLKKSERRISNILNLNSSDTVTDLKKSNFPSSKGYSILYKSKESNLKFIQDFIVTSVVVSKQNNGFLVTVHENKNTNKNLACLWDMNASNGKPLKILTAIDTISLSLFNGKPEGIFVAVLKDCSIHLWDLSESPTIVQKVEKPSKMVEVNSEGMTQTEYDREWNLRNSHVVAETPCPILQACAYTSSAVTIETDDPFESIVGMDFVDEKVYRIDGARKIVGQICTLQSIGVLSTWLIVQHKQNTPEKGKAFWSRMKLEKNYQINLTDYIDPVVSIENDNFNLTAAKKRVAVKKCARGSRVNSSVRPSTARSKKKMVTENWENGVLCNDLRVTVLEKMDCFLVGKNCGEVLCCRRMAGAVKVQRFCVSDEKYSITLLEVSSSGLPYFLAATDTGVIHLCSLLENRVLLTLDCGNITPETLEKYGSDHKGRYTGTVPVKPADYAKSGINRFNITSISWSSSNPCRVVTRIGTEAAVWDLTKRDIYATTVAQRCNAAKHTLDGHVVLLTDGELQLHQQQEKSTSNQNIEIFKRYVSLL